jgi:D-alanyl-lipoteichoic acid acyltransferase DltB (MBOAT superfamily)
MLFNSYQFLLVFLPITWGVFQLIAPLRSATLSTLWLVTASLAFYGYWNVAYVFLLLLSIAANFLISGVLSQVPETKRRRGKLLLAFGVAFNLGLLGYYKYANFLVDNINLATGLDAQIVQVVLPIGISFFTFQQIAYLVDVHRREAFEHDLPKFTLFVCFFPQLIAGPIVHHREMMPQFGRQRRSEILPDVAVGLTIFVIGLCKKVLIADTVAMPASAVFDAVATGAAPGFIDCWVAAFCYTFQIYFDFSGYSDMAIGLGRMFGIRLPANFASPYKATSIVDFWRRWHITLSRFLRDYLYIPLGGNLCGAKRRYANVFVTMLLGGIWHGAGWTFVLWGAMHSTLIVINQYWSAWRKRTARGTPRGGPLTEMLCRSLTFLTIVCTWVPFRASDLDTTFVIYAGMLDLGGSMGPVLVSPIADPTIALSRQVAGVPMQAIAILCGLPSLVWIVWRMPNTQEIMRWIGPATPTAGYALANSDDKSIAGPLWTGSLGWAALTGVLLALCLGKLNDVSEFIYFQF